MSKSNQQTQVKDLLYDEQLERETNRKKRLAKCLSVAGELGNDVMSAYYFELLERCNKDIEKLKRLMRERERDMGKGKR